MKPITILHNSGVTFPLLCRIEKWNNANLSLRIHFLIPMNFVNRFSEFWNLFFGQLICSEFLYHILIFSCLKNRIGERDVKSLLMIIVPGKCQIHINWTMTLMLSSNFSQLTSFRPEYWHVILRHIPVAHASCVKCKNS